MKTIRQKKTLMKQYEKNLHWRKKKGKSLELDAIQIEKGEEEINMGVLEIRGHDANTR